MPLGIETLWWLDAEHELGWRDAFACVRVSLGAEMDSAASSVVICRDIQGGL